MKGEDVVRAFELLEEMKLLGNSYESKLCSMEVLSAEIKSKNNGSNWSLSRFDLGLKLWSLRIQLIDDKNQLESMVIELNEIVKGIKEEERLMQALDEAGYLIK